MLNQENARCAIRLGQSEDGRWVAEVVLPVLPAEALEGILDAVRLYNTLDSVALPRCIVSEDSPGTLFFIVSEVAHPEPHPVFGVEGADTLSSTRCLELTHHLAEIARMLHAAGLGLWEINPRLSWRVDQRIAIIPAFWIPFLGRDILQADRQVPPEVLQSEPSSFSERADIFAISYACYEAIADAPPRLPNPKLPGEWSTELSSWDAALDAGLRMRPERRPTTLLDWVALLPSANVRDSQPAQPKALTQTPPLATNRKKRSRKSLLLALLCITGLLILGASLLKIVPESMKPSGYQRGFADSILRYANKTYQGTKWKTIYSQDRLLPARGRFKMVSGWDRANFAVFGYVGGDTLLLFCQNGEWRVHRFAAHGILGNHIRAGRFLEPNKIVLLLGKGSLDSTLAIFEPAGHRELGDINGHTSLYLLAHDVFCGSEWIGHYWKYSGGNVSNVERRSREKYVLTEENAIAQCAIDNGSEKKAMELGWMRSVTTIEPGKAAGLWSTPYGGAAIIRYHNGLWYKVQELPGYVMNDVPKTAWFMDERNMVAVGATKVTRVAEGVITKQGPEVAGEEYPADALRLVWGNNMNCYWVADQKGNVFGFNGTQWHLVVRGPDFKSDEKFDGMWASPEGSVIAVTEESVYCLE